MRSSNGNRTAVALISPEHALSMREQAHRALRDCATVFDAMDVRVTAAAVRAYSKAAKDRSLEIEAVAIRTRAERRLGQMLAEGRERGEVAKHTGEGGSKDQKYLAEFLHRHRRHPKVSARSGILARMDDDEYEATESAWRENMATAVRVTLPKVGKPRDPVRYSVSVPVPGT